eukprot:2353679-Prymnesium_polylepis.1
MSNVCAALYWVPFGPIVPKRISVHVCCKGIGKAITHRSTYSQGIHRRCLERSAAQRELDIVTDRYDCTLPTHVTVFSENHGVNISRCYIELMKRRIQIIRRTLPDLKNVADMTR